MLGHGGPTVAAEPAARLFDEYGEQLYRFCLGRMRSREEAEDALQSTFLRAHKALAKGVVPEYEAAWLYKIAHNVCLSRRAAIARHGRVISLHEREDIELTVAAPEGRSDELFGLSDALADLPANLRQAILLREWQGLSYAEIADAMGTSVSAVETLIFRARRELAASLETDGKKKPRRSRLVDLGALLGRLFSLKVATGAALLAVGGAGIGTAVELAHHAGTGPATPQPTLLSTPIVAVVATPQPAAARARHHVAAAADAAPKAPPPAAAESVGAPAAAQPQQPAAATTTDLAAPTAPAVPAVSTAPPVETPSLTVADVPVPAVPVALPTAPVPTVPVPTVPVPSVPVPTVPVPTVPVPQLPADLGP